MAIKENKPLEVSSVKPGVWVTLGFPNAEIGEEMIPARVFSVENGKVTFIMFGSTMFRGNVRGSGDEQTCTLSQIERKEVCVYEFVGDADEINEIIKGARFRISMKREKLNKFECAVNMPTPTI